MFTETEQGAIIPSMGRTPTTDRNNVTAEDSPVIAMRLTPREAMVLDSLVRMQQEQADELGIAGAVTRASAMRQLLRQAAKAKGIWDASDSHPAPVEPQHDSEADLATVLAAAHAELEQSSMAPLVMVPAVVRASKLTTERAHAALSEADRRQMLELRPESGMGRLSKPDAALCLPGPQGSMLSVLRVVGAEAPVGELGPAAVAARIEQALTAGRFESAAELARVAGLGPNDVSRIRAGHGLRQDKLTKLDEALAARKV
jgi:hypothetical protein